MTRLFLPLQLAVDSIENIDTVVSLGIEDKFYELFKAETLRPYRFVQLSPNLLFR